MTILKKDLSSLRKEFKAVEKKMAMLLKAVQIYSGFIRCKGFLVSPDSVQSVGDRTWCRFQL